MSGIDGRRGNFLKLDIDSDEEMIFNIEHFEIPKFAGQTVDISVADNKVIFDFDTVLIRKEIIEISSQELNFFFGLDNNKRNSCLFEIQVSMETLNRVWRVAQRNKRDELLSELEVSLTDFMQKYQTYYPEYFRQ